MVPKTEGGIDGVPVGGTTGREGKAKGGGNKEVFPSGLTTGATPTEEPIIGTTEGATKGAGVGTTEGATKGAGVGVLIPGT